MHGFGDVRFFDRIAPLYDRVMPAADPAVFARGFDHATGPVRRVLDIGGGSGRASLALGERCDPDFPVVVDLSRGMLERARERGLSAIHADATRLPIHANTADAAVVVDALHHIPHHATLFDELARAIRPGGVVVIREFDPSHPLGAVLALGERVIGMDSSFETPDSLVADLDAAGFECTVLDRGFAYTVIGRVREAPEPNRSG